MSPLNLARRSLLALYLCAAAAGVLAQTQQPTPPYQPQVGQQGKDVVWVPTPETLVGTMLDLGKVTASDYLMDLGSGDGRIVIAAAKRGARALGIEYEPRMVELSRHNAIEQHVTDKASFAEADLFQTDFSQATVITMFLLPQINLQLRPKILELKPGTRIVSNSFTMGEWEADETAKAAGDCSSYCTALLWIVPAKAQGTWQLPQGELTIEQTFQMISGTLTSGGSGTPIKDGRLRGEEISFSAGEARYTGRVNGNVMEGTVKSGETVRNWRATRVG